MKLSSSLTLTLLIITSGLTQATPQLTSEQIEIQNLIEQIYSYDPATFENGVFDRQLRPYTRKYLPNKQAKYDPTEQCKLLKTMFIEAMLPVKSSKKECDPMFSRFPNLGAEDLSPATRDSLAFTEKFSIGSPIVQGIRAKVAVFTKGARSLYFLTKTDQGWRVSNEMIHWKWPDLDDGTHNCYYRFVLPPSPEEKKEIFPHCR